MNLTSLNIGELGRQIFARLLKSTASDGTLDDILYECEQQNEPYCDEEFPASNQSLVKNWRDPSCQDKQNWKQFKWLRPQEITSIKTSGKEIGIFVDSIDPSDINQGLLGDCYFLSCLSVLAENPQRIRRLFVTDQINEYGVYGVRICKNGEWREIVIDDRIPCQRGEPAFSKAIGNELWVPLMEKAWAKLHGSYDRVEAGFAENALRDLTGAPCEVIDSDEPNLWSKLMEAEKKGFLIAASAGKTDASKELLKNLGLVGSHSYGVLDVREVTLDNGRQEKLIKIRNPWGNFEWNGDWGDESKLWTPSLEKQVGLQKQNDGIFFMNMKDFCHYFGRVQICRIDDNFKHSSFKCNQSSGSYCLIKFVVQTDGLYNLSLLQQDERCFDRSDNYDYSIAKFILAKITSQNESKLELEYIGGILGKERDMYKEYQMLKKGEYYIFAEIDWVDGAFTSEFTLSSYGTGQTFFLRDDSQLYSKQEILSQIFLNCALQQLPDCNYSNYEKDQEPNIHKYYQVCKEGYRYIVYNNLSQDSTLVECVTYLVFDGLELVKPYKGQSFEITLKPKEKKIVLIKDVNPFSNSIRTQIQQKICFSTQKLLKLCKEKGEMSQREDSRSKQPVDIYQYELEHPNGICYLYENKTSNKTLEENIKFTINGLEIVEKPADGSNTVKVKLGPGESKLIELQKTSLNGYSISAGISYLVK
eukprot:403352333